MEIHGSNCQPLKLQLQRTVSDLSNRCRTRRGLEKTHFPNAQQGGSTFKGWVRKACKGSSLATVLALGLSCLKSVNSHRDAQLGVASLVTVAFGLVSSSRVESVRVKGCGPPCHRDRGGPRRFSKEVVREILTRCRERRSSKKVMRVVMKRCRERGAVIDFERLYSWVVCPDAQTHSGLFLLAGILSRVCLYKVDDCFINAG